MKIAVIGATRGIGLALVQAALADGHDVSAFVRRPDRMPVSHLRLRIVAGDAQERIIASNPTRWIIVRHSFLTNGPRTGRYRALTDLQGIRGGRISRADVADFMLLQAKSPQFIGKTPLLIYLGIQQITSSGWRCAWHLYPQAAHLPETQGSAVRRR